jgi:hypothetical protein
MIPTNLNDIYERQATRKKNRVRERNAANFSVIAFRVERSSSAWLHSALLAIVIFLSLDLLLSVLVGRLARVCLRGS